MIRLFGYDDASGRNWINLEWVTKAKYHKSRSVMEITIASGEGKAGEKVELQGDVAANFAKTMALIESDGKKT